MTLRFIGTSSEDGECPTLYEVEGTDNILVQGDRVTNPSQLAELRDVADSETFVIVPRDLLIRFAPRSAPRDMVPFADVAHLFREFKHTAWRLETRRGYAADRGTPKWERWQRGEDISADPDNEWRANVRKQTAGGKRFERVRLLDSPITEGQLYLLDSGLGNVAAGEDIRNMPRAEAAQLGLPDWDFWLFDSRVLVRFVFDEQDTTLGVIVSEDPAEVLAACQARDAAWHHATPTAEVHQRVRSTM
ncbi:DUF6879 family protein [Streptomyces sp. MST-110588]|uniref:DUF6879 family protein n=1 Tax=Streptomyces sp. MST-110588 TaxID=2833628 RepID=UPI001F5D1BA8|nr:DUF6879 family protein [Streptomyces sp. MST-110588]UNO41886.1 hypothetical protein KGS77_23020 [Streptomyces sp. MST-110588]